MKRAAAVALALLMLCACISPKESGVKVIVGAKLWNMEYSVVVIEDGKFRAVGPQSSTPVPKGAEITRGLGMTIEPLPGGTPIEPGKSADLVLKGDPDRVMRGGEWIK